MDIQTLVTITTSALALIGALATALSTVRRGELEALERRVTTLEADLAEERGAHKAERDAHADTRKELAETNKQLAEAYEKLRKCMERRNPPRRDQLHPV